MPITARVPKCRNPFEDRVVKARLDARKKDLLCPICEKKTPLVNLLASPTAAAESVAAQIDSDAKAGRRRMTAAFVIKAKEAEGKFDVFLSHNSKDKAAVEKIAKQLKAVGLRPWLDKWNPRRRRYVSRMPWSRPSRRFHARRFVSARRT